jgi:hypothetical protein
MNMTTHYYIIRSYKDETPSFAEGTFAGAYFTEEDAYAAWEALQQFCKAVENFNNVFQGAPNGLDRFYVMHLNDLNSGNTVKLAELVMPDYSAYWDE